MRILSVNLGQAATLAHGERSFVTGIDKWPAGRAINVTELGLDEDAVCDTEHHGGPDQAVYIYSANDYAWWSLELGREIRPGTFGENLTVAEFPDDMDAGDRLLVGDLILEATAPRIPCATFAAQMRDSNFPLRFRYAERPGVYFRVLHSGEVSAGDAVTSVPNTADSVSMLDMFRAWYQARPDAELLQRIVNAPVAERVRKRFADKLRAMESG
jgi:MOSC domain-containing protein YiiM